jgi:hypothetical protein
MGSLNKHQKVFWGSHDRLSQEALLDVRFDQSHFPHAQKVKLSESPGKSELPMELAQAATKVGFSLGSTKHSLRTLPDLT